MRKSEIFDILLEKTAEICEVNSGLIIGGSKFQAVVDARVLLVQYLKRIGLSDDDIALITLRKLHNNMEYTPPMKDLKKKSKVVNRIFGAYSQRCMESYAFCLMSVELKDFCRSRYSDVYSYGMKQLPSM